MPPTVTRRGCRRASTYDVDATWPALTTWIPHPRRTSDMAGTSTPYEPTVGVYHGSRQCVGSSVTPGVARSRVRVRSGCSAVSPVRVRSADGLREEPGRRYQLRLGGEREAEEQGGG